MRLLLVDFDRTLFDTDRFSSAVWAIIAERYGVDLERERVRGQTEFRRHFHDQMYDYDFYGHLASLGIKRDEIDALLHERLDGQQFLYDDAMQVIGLEDYETRIVTFGGEDYQRLKLSFCPEVAAVPADIVQQIKAHYLHETYPDREGFLIDDKPLMSDEFPELPKGITFLWLNRQSDHSFVDYDSYLEINSLTAASEVL